MEDGALDDTLEAERGLRVDLPVGGDARGLLGDVLSQALAQLVHVGATGTQHFCRSGIVEQGEQQVFDGDELVALLARLDKRHVQADFELLGDHFCSWPFTFLLRLLHHTLQRVLVLSRVCRDLLHFGGRDIPRIDPTDADTFPMHLQHHLRGPFPRHAEELLQHQHDEFHRRVVIVQQHDLEH
jgi:hypothetical protein